MHLIRRLCFNRKPSRGSAIILVLFCIVVMAVAFMGMVDLVEMMASFSEHRSLDLDAESLARSGLALAENPLVKRDDPILRQKLVSGRSFRAKIESEGARLNVNFLLVNQDRVTLTNLFTAWGLTAEQCDHIIDCLHDWVSPQTDVKSLNGATDADYQKAGLPLPKHRPFQSLDEIREVIGFGLVTEKRPNWDDSFTVWSSGPLNVSEAPANLIEAVCSSGSQETDEFVELRNGPDHEVGTSDDLPLKGLSDLQEGLGLSSEEINGVAHLISFSDPVMRIESTGRSGDRQVRVIAVIRQNASSIETLSWSVR
jgi:type II secretory pathway component PulK